MYLVIHAGVLQQMLPRLCAEVTLHLQRSDDEIHKNDIVLIDAA